VSVQIKYSKPGVESAESQLNHVLVEQKSTCATAPLKDCLISWMWNEFWS
jgi:hypothetical protein